MRRAATAPHLTLQMALSQQEFGAVESMAGSCRRVGRFAIRAASAAAAAFALACPVDAQWLPPFGAAPPAEIVQRLRAEGYVLARPLQRRDTVYLADVAHGPRGRERLVVDAWSGEILQKFLVRRGEYVPEGGEFSEPPPLGPPPARDFGEGTFYSGPGAEAPPRARARTRSSVAHRGGEPKPKPVGQENVGSENPAAATPAAAPAAASTSSTASPSPSPSAEPVKEVRPATAPSPAPTEAKEAAPSAPAPDGGKGEKKLNDVPVNPLD